jgi:hypothetical protein
MSEGATIGRIVWYRSRTGLYSCPAMITATVDTLYQPNVDAGYIAPLSSPDHIHLTVMTPGKPGKRATADDFKVVSEHPIQENVGGLYQEFDIPFWQPDDLSAPFYAPGDASPQPAGTWTWPQRA